MKRKIKPGAKVFVPFGGMGKAEFDITTVVLKCPSFCDMESFFMEKFGYVVPHIHFNDEDGNGSLWALTDKVYVYAT